MIHIGNRTEWSPIRSVIIRVITKSDDHEAGLRFVFYEDFFFLLFYFIFFLFFTFFFYIFFLHFHEDAYRLNWTTR